MKLALSEERVKSLIVQVHPFVLSHLHSEFREDIDQLEERYDKRIIFEYARDLVLGDARIFYVNDRDLRVLYDLDQKINQYVREAEFQSKVNVALPVASLGAVSYTHLRAHETVLDLVCRLLLEKKKQSMSVLSHAHDLDYLGLR